MVIGHPLLYWTLICCSLYRGVYVFPPMEQWRMHVELRKDMDFEGFEPHALRKTNYFHEKVH